MAGPGLIAVLDVGKTNAKLAVVDPVNMTEVEVLTRPNRVSAGPPYPHFDLDALWSFFVAGLADLHARHGIAALSVTAHGASGVLLAEDGTLAAPMLDYEHDGPDRLAAAYNALRPGFDETGSPRLPGGLNLGAQLHWLLETQPGLRDKLAWVVTYPQYWGYRLTGALACDLSSLGCHTDLWNPWEGRFSPLVRQLGLDGRIAPPRRPGEVLGHLQPEVAAATGLPQSTPVMVGIHDSNASLYPHLRGRSGPFAVVSTGTWVIAMAVGGARVALDPARDLLVNVAATGAAVPSARFMGGREYERMTDGTAPTAAARSTVLSAGVALYPAVEAGSGPFAGRAARWSGAEPTGAVREVALSFHLALMTATCLDLIGAKGPVIVEGPFGRNGDYVEMLAALFPEGVEVAGSATGTAIGAALLAVPDGGMVATRNVAVPPDAAALRDYAAAWRHVVG